MPQWITVGSVSEFADGSARVVAGPSKRIAVFRSGDEFFAIDDMCPHAGASLAGGFVEDGIVTCPWHYWRFRLSDGAWADNPRIKTGCYRVEVADEAVRLEVPDPPTVPSVGPA